LLADERRHVILRAGSSQRETKSGGEDIVMTDNNTGARKHEEAAKLKTYQRERDLQRRGVKVDAAIQGLTDDDRRMIINKSLRKVNSALSVG
jgi:hypothetical protein